MALAPAREAFMPPPTPGMGRAVFLALLAHAVLVLALSFAVQWHQSKMWKFQIRAESYICQAPGIYVNIFGVP